MTLTKTQLDALAAIIEAKGGGAIDKHGRVLLGG